MAKYNVVAAGPPLRTGDLIKGGLNAKQAIDALEATKASQGPAYVCDEAGGLVGPRELERRSKGKTPK